jgi:hypothetical protein
MTQLGYSVAVVQCKTLGLCECEGHEAVQQHWMGPQHFWKPALSFELQSQQKCSNFAISNNMQKAVRHKPVGLQCGSSSMKNLLRWAYVKDMKQCSSIGWVHNTFGSQLWAAISAEMLQLCHQQ